MYRTPPNPYALDRRLSDLEAERTGERSDWYHLIYFGWVLQPNHWFQPIYCLQGENGAVNYYGNYCGLN